MTTIERTLLFTGLRLLGWVLLLGGVALVLTVTLYAVERKLIRPRVGLLLVVLRALAVALLLMMFLEPVISVTETTRHRATVLVMVDVSHSMEIPDSTLPPGECLGLQCALGRLPDSIRTSPLSGQAEQLALTERELKALLIDWRRLTDSLALQQVRSSPLLGRLKELVKQLNEWRDATRTVVGLLAQSARNVKGTSELADGLTHAIGRLEQEVLDQVNRALADLTGADRLAAMDVTGMDRLTRQLEHAAAVIGETSRVIGRLAEQHNDILARQLSPSLRSELDRMTRSTRLELVEELVTTRNRQLLRGLADRYDVAFRTFAGQLSVPLSPGPGADDAPLNLDDPHVDLARDSSDLATNLHAALAQLSDRKLAAVVLVSDGRFNRGKDPVGALDELVRRRVPLHAVLVGGTQPPKDVSLVSVDAPDTLFESDRAAVSVVVQGFGFDGQTARVSLREGSELVSHKTVTLSDGNPRQLVGFSYTPDGIGEHVLDVEIASLAGEVIPNNNRTSHVLRVVKDRSRVLLIDGAPRWEYRFLKNALIRDERIDLTYLLFDPVALSGQEPESARQQFDKLTARTAPGTAEGKTPGEVEKLFAFDVIILGDLKSDSLSGEQIQLLESFVADRGGTLVVIAGRTGMPVQFKGTRFERLLPIVPDRRPGGLMLDAGYRFTPTLEGDDSEILKMSADPVENEEIWQGLPASYWVYPVERLKPGATVLAECVAFDGADTDARATDARNAVRDVRKTSQGRALLVQQSYGLGKVLWLGTDSTWRWRCKVADKYHHRFWGQVIRWATSGRLPVGTDTIRFGTDKGNYLDGQDVAVRARILNDDLTPVTNAMVEAVLVNEGRSDKAEELARVPLSYLSDSGGRYVGVFPNVKIGRYSVRLVVAGRDEELKDISTPFTVCSAPVRELVDLGANKALMRQLASRTGGRLHRVWELPDLPAHLPDVSWTERKHHQTLLWQSYYLLAAFCILVAVEWVVRKRSGLL